MSQMLSDDPRFDEKVILKQRLLEAKRKIDEDAETIEYLRAVLDQRLLHLDHVRSTIYKELISMRELLYKQAMSHNAGNNYIPEFVVSLEYVSELCNREFFLAAENPNQDEQKIDDAALLALEQLAKAKEEALHAKVNLEKRYKEQLSRKQFEMDQLQRKMDAMQAEAQAMVDAVRDQYEVKLKELKVKHDEERAESLESVQRERLQFQAFVEDMKDKEEKVTSMLKKRMSDKDEHIKSLGNMVTEKENEVLKVRAELEKALAQLRRPSAMMMAASSADNDSFFLTSGGGGTEESSNTVRESKRAARAKREAAAAASSSQQAPQPPHPPPPSSASAPDAPPLLLPPSRPPVSNEVVVGPPPPGTAHKQQGKSSKSSKSLSVAVNAAMASSHLKKPVPPKDPKQPPAKVSSQTKAPTEKEMSEVEEFLTKHAHQQQQQQGEEDRPQPNLRRLVNQHASAQSPPSSPRKITSQELEEGLQLHDGGGVASDDQCGGTEQRATTTDDDEAENCSEGEEAESPSALTATLDTVDESEAVESGAREESREHDDSKNFELRMELRSVRSHVLELELLVARLKEDNARMEEERGQLREGNGKAPAAAISNERKTISGNSGSRRSARAERTNSKVSLSLPLDKLMSADNTDSPMASSVRAWKADQLSTDRENELVSSFSANMNVVPAPPPRQTSAPVRRTLDSARSSTSTTDQPKPPLEAHSAPSPRPTATVPASAAPSSTSSATTRISSAPPLSSRAPSAPMLPSLILPPPQLQPQPPPPRTSGAETTGGESLEFFMTCPPTADDSSLDIPTPNDKALFVLSQIEKSFLQMSVEDQNEFVARSKQALAVLFGIVSAEMQRRSSRQASRARGDNDQVAEGDVFDDPIASGRFLPRNASAPVPRKYVVRTRSRSPPYDEFPRSLVAAGSSQMSRFPLINASLPSFVRFDIGDVTVPLFSGLDEDFPLRITRSMLSPRGGSPTNVPPRSEPALPLPPSFPPPPLAPQPPPADVLPSSDLQHTNSAPSLLPPPRGLDTTSSTLRGQTMRTTFTITKKPESGGIPQSPRLPAVVQAPMPQPPSQQKNNRTESPVFREYNPYVVYEVDPDYLVHGTPPSSGLPTRPSAPRPLESQSSPRRVFEAPRTAVTTQRETKLVLAQPTGDKRDSFSVAISSFKDKDKPPRKSTYQLYSEEKTIRRE